MNAPPTAARPSATATGAHTGLTAAIAKMFGCPWQRCTIRRALVQVALTNPLERVNRELSRRTDVVGIFPTTPPCCGWPGCCCLEQNDEWLVGRCYLSETSMALVLAAATDQDRDREEVLELTAS